LVKKSKLTQEMIDQGKAGDACKCPIALFFAAEFGTPKVNVDILNGKTVSVTVNGKEIKVENSTRLFTFMAKFDNLFPVKPMWIEYESEQA